MRKAIKNIRFIGASVLFASMGAILIFFNLPFEPEEEVERTQEAVNSLELNVELFPSLKIID